MQQRRQDCIGRMPSRSRCRCRTPVTRLENAGLKSISDVTSRLMITAPISRHLCAGGWQGRGAFTHTAYNDYEIVR